MFDFGKHGVWNPFVAVLLPLFSFAAAWLIFELTFTKVDFAHGIHVQADTSMVCTLVNVHEDCRCLQLSVFIKFYETLLTDF